MEGAHTQVMTMTTTTYFVKYPFLNVFLQFTSSWRFVHRHVICLLSGKCSLMIKPVKVTAFLHEMKDKMKRGSHARDALGLLRGP